MSRRRGVSHPHPVLPARLAGAALVGVGLVHALWATGSSWPAKDRRALAEATAGTSRMPGAGPTALVAVGAVGAGLVTAGVFGEGRAVSIARRAIGLVLVGRGLTGGALATTLLGMPAPSSTFRRLDATVYRPLCAVLGTAILGAAR